MTWRHALLMCLPYLVHCAMLINMTSHTDPDLVGSTEACRILDIHAATLGRWVKAGIIRPAHKLPGKNGAYLFVRSEIARLRDELAETA